MVALALFPQALLFAQDRQEPATLLTVWAGMLPIILSAPHGGRESISGVPLRRGIGVAQFTTERDNNTAALTEAVGNAISDRLGVFVGEPLPWTGDRRSYMRQLDERMRQLAAEGNFPAWN